VLISLAIASTEPPSEDGGERAALALRRPARCLLQRSRRPKTAESRDRLAMPATDWRASTEPPSEDGGESSGVRHSVRSFMLQRSRRPKTAESEAGRGLTGLQEVRFNGAAVRRRRRALLHGDNPSQCGASTEPPSEDGGEPPDPPDGAS